MSAPVADPAVDDAADEAPLREPVPWRLPWVRTVALIVVLCFAAGVVGWWIGRPAARSMNQVDVGFLADMTEHHSGAINLAFTYLGVGHDEVLTSMAREIVTDQSQEIGAMNGLLADADDTSTVGDGTSMDWMGHPVASARMPGLATAEDYAKLKGETGLAADDDFSRLMIRHHEAGAEMAEYAAANGEDGDVRELARRMAKAQRFEISEMNLRREALGLAPVTVKDLIATSGS